MKITEYAIHWNGAKAVFAVDREIYTDKACVKQIKLSSRYSEEELKTALALDEPVVAMLKVLAKTCFGLQMVDHWARDGLLMQFEKMPDHGWPELDGSEGISIESVIPPSIPLTSFDVQVWESYEFVL